MKNPILAFFLIFPCIAQAAQSFQLKDAKVRIEVPQGWQEARDLYGMPLMLLGPEAAGGRPVISVTPTGLGKSQLDAQSLVQDEAGFRQGREAWLKKMNGKAIAYSKYRALKWEGIEQAHAIGYRYEIGGVEHVEYSYFVLCKGQFHHVKTLVRAGHEDAYRATVDQIVKSFGCE